MVRVVAENPTDIKFEELYSKVSNIVSSGNKVLRNFDPATLTYTVVEADDKWNKLNSVKISTSYLRYISSDQYSKFERLWEQIPLAKDCGIDARKFLQELAQHPEFKLNIPCAHYYKLAPGEVALSETHHDFDTNRIHKTIIELETYSAQLQIPFNSFIQDDSLLISKVFRLKDELERTIIKDNPYDPDITRVWVRSGLSVESMNNIDTFTSTIVLWTHLGFSPLFTSIKEVSLKDLFHIALEQIPLDNRSSLALEIEYRTNKTFINSVIDIIAGNSLYKNDTKLYKDTKLYDRAITYLERVSPKEEDVLQDCNYLGGNS